jgi:hypothetical protein
MHFTAWEKAIILMCIHVLLLVLVFFYKSLESLCFKSYVSSILFDTAETCVMCIQCTIHYACTSNTCAVFTHVSVNVHKPRCFTTL